MPGKPANHKGHEVSLRFPSCNFAAFVVNVSQQTLGASPVLLVLLLVQFDAQRFQKLQVLIADLEVGVGAEG